MLTERYTRLAACYIRLAERSRSKLHCYVGTRLGERITGSVSAVEPSSPAKSTQALSPQLPTSQKFYILVKIKIF